MPSHLIHSAWLDGSGPVLISSDPAAGQILWQGHHATADEVDAALRAARAAQPGWASAPLAQRIALIERFAALLQAERNNPSLTALPAIISRETGKPRWEALTEVDSMINKAAISIHAQNERRSPSLTATAGATTATRYKPHGVAAVFGPFNFPGHLPNGHIIPALLAGNTIVFKPSELTPWVAQRTCELWLAAGLPLGVLNLVQGARETGQALANHPEIDGLFFTGSVAGGVAINKTLASRPNVILALEMGGNNPLVAWKIAPERHGAAALLIIQSAFATAGQRCSCARRLIIEAGPAGNGLIDQVKDLISRLHIGPWTDSPEPFMGPLINAAAAENAMRAQARLIELGGVAIVPMSRLSSLAASFVSPGLIDMTGVANPPDEEIFAPLLQIIRVETFDRGIDAANRTAFGLCAALLSDDAALYEEFFARIRAGVVNFNRPTTGASSALPFGGIGLSGNHRPSAAFAADYCSYPVASMEAPVLAAPEKLPIGIRSK